MHSLNERQLEKEKNETKLVTTPNWRKRDVTELLKKQKQKQKQM